MKIAAQIVDEIIKDICDRSGLQNDWENIDEELQIEIKLAWIKIINRFQMSKDIVKKDELQTLKCPRCNKTDPLFVCKECYQDLLHKIQVAENQIERGK